MVTRETFVAQHNRLGALGEELAEKFLVKRGFTIIDRNYRKPWGELDIVARKRATVHFVEVKSRACSVSDETSAVTPRKIRELRATKTEKTPLEEVQAYIRSGLKKDRFRPEDSVNSKKTKRLGRIIQTYLNARHVSDETPWQFDVVTIQIDEQTRRAKINYIEDLIL